jgi:hypothetical protein
MAVPLKMTPRNIPQLYHVGIVAFAIQIKRKLPTIFRLLLLRMVYVYQQIISAPFALMDMNTICLPVNALMKIMSKINRARSEQILVNKTKPALQASGVKGLMDQL